MFSSQKRVVSTVKKPDIPQNKKESVNQTKTHAISKPIDIVRDKVDKKVSVLERNLSPTKKEQITPRSENKKKQETSSASTKEREKSQSKPETKQEHKAHSKSESKTQLKPEPKTQSSQKPHKNKQDSPAHSKTQSRTRSRNSSPHPSDPLPQKTPLLKLKDPREKPKKAPEKHYREGQRIYVAIRHACDNKDHTDYKFIHDPPLCTNEKHKTRDIEKLIQELYHKCHGYPDEIITSPMRRCLQTALIMKNYIDLQNQKSELESESESEPVTLTLEKNVSRYFTPSEQEYPLISMESVEHEVPITETKQEFERRVEKHIRHVMKKKTKRVVWCVTHAYFLKRLDIVLKDKNKWDHIPPLGYKMYAF
jgi:broad specificity phosphatase PhoE